MDTEKIPDTVLRCISLPHYNSPLPSELANELMTVTVTWPTQEQSVAWHVHGLPPPSLLCVWILIYHASSAACLFLSHGTDPWNGFEIIVISFSSSPGHGLRTCGNRFLSPFWWTLRYAAHVTLQEKAHCPSCWACCQPLAIASATKLPCPRSCPFLGWPVSNGWQM